MGAEIDCLFERPAFQKVLKFQFKATSFRPRRPFTILSFSYRSAKGEIRPSPRSHASTVIRMLNDFFGSSMSVRLLQIPIAPKCKSTFQSCHPSTVYPFAILSLLVSQASSESHKYATKHLYRTIFSSRHVFGRTCRNNAACEGQHAARIIKIVKMHILAQKSNLTASEMQRLDFLQTVCEVKVLCNSEGAKQ